MAPRQGTALATASLSLMAWGLDEVERVEGPDAEGDDVGRLHDVDHLAQVIGAVAQLGVGGTVVAALLVLGIALDGVGDEEVAAAEAGVFEEALEVLAAAVALEWDAGDRGAKASRGLADDEDAGPRSSR